MSVTPIEFIVVYMNPLGDHVDAHAKCNRIHFQTMAQYKFCTFGFVYVFFDAKSGKNICF